MQCASGQKIDFIFESIYLFTDKHAKVSEITKKSNNQCAMSNENLNYTYRH